MNFFAAEFQRVDCQCNNELIEGTYCEKHIPPCNIKTCYENVTCYNNASNPYLPCGPCPHGYTGDGETCHGKQYLKTIYSDNNRVIITSSMCDGCFQ